MQGSTERGRAPAAIRCAPPRMPWRPASSPGPPSRGRIRPAVPFFRDRDDILFVGAHRSWRAPQLGMPAHRSAFLGTTPPQEAPAGRGPVAPALATPASTGTSVMWSSRFARDLQAQQARVGESKSAFQSKAAASYRDEDLPPPHIRVARSGAGLRRLQHRRCCQVAVVVLRVDMRLPSTAAAVHCPCALAPSRARA